MTTQKTFFGRSQLHKSEDEADKFASRFCFGSAIILLAGTMVYNVVNKVNANQTASPERVVEVSKQVQATAWDECKVDYNLTFTPGTYIAERLKANQPINNATLDYLLDKVVECNHQRRKKQADASTAKAQKAALN